MSNLGLLTDTTAVVQRCGEIGYRVSIEMLPFE